MVCGWSRAPPNPHSHFNFSSSHGELPPFVSGLNYLFPNCRKRILTFVLPS